MNDATKSQDVNQADLQHVVDGLVDALNEIGDYAHDRSTGPAVPDALWEIRGMAYVACDLAAASPVASDDQAAALRGEPEAAGQDRDLAPPRVTGSPTEIWLNYGDIEDDCTHDECYRDGDVTWCQDKVFDSDVRYVLAEPPQAASGSSHGARSDAPITKFGIKPHSTLAQLKDDEDLRLYVQAHIEEARSAEQGATPLSPDRIASIAAGLDALDPHDNVLVEFAELVAEELRGAPPAPAARELREAAECALAAYQHRFGSVAPPIGKYTGPIDEEMTALRSALAASPQPVAPEGWKLVPIKLTEEMHAAAVRTIQRCTGNDDFPPRVWRAMIAAAPSAEGGAS